LPSSSLFWPSSLSLPFFSPPPAQHCYFSPSLSCLSPLLSLPLSSLPLSLSLSLALSHSRCAPLSLLSLFPSLHLVTDNAEKAFEGVDYAFLVGAQPRTKGMERGDLLSKNAAIFSVQGKALSKTAKAKDTSEILLSFSSSSSSPSSTSSSSSSSSPSSY